MTNKQYVLDALRETTEDVKRVNADAKSIIKLSIEKWTSVIKNNDDVLSSLFGLRKELIKIAYRKCTPGILVALTESSTHKIFTFKLNTASEHIECMVESAEHSTEPELFSVIIGNNVEIGANTTIDRAQMESTVIGNGVKIDNLCQIAHNVQIGDNTVMAAQCGIAGSTIIGKNCIFGGQVGIAGHIKIADHTTLGAQAGVIGNIRKSGEVLIGSPVIPVRQYMKAYAKFKQAAEE